VISAIHGVCIGGGVDLVTACDIRLCTKDTKFSVRETKIAIVADLGTLQRITRICGRGFTREIALTGDDIEASRAYHFGLVNQVYENQEDLMIGARKMANNISSNSPLVVQGTKHILEYSEDHTVEEGTKYTALWNSAFLKSDDLKEAIMSFMSKKKPVFKNRL
jgi:enoyl-CoA hydratase/carnithine racemase